MPAEPAGRRAATRVRKRLLGSSNRPMATTGRPILRVGRAGWSRARG